MTLHTKYFPINLGRVVIFLLSLALASSYSNIVMFISFLIGASVLYLLLETIFGISEINRFIPYIATSFDIIATMVYCYLTGLCSVFYGAFIYITAICALNPRNKQAEYSVIFSVFLQIIVVLLVGFGKIKFVNIFFSNAFFNLASSVTTIIVTFVVNIMVFSIIRDLVKKNYNLLCNIIPESILPFLQENKVVSQSVDCSTIVFTDFVSFTETTKNLAPEIIVKNLEYYFNAFDTIIQKNNVEKLKTIGDGYMFVSGLPEHNDNHRQNAIMAAKEILEFCLDNVDNNVIKFKIRIGICSGPVMAAIIGKKKFQYDVWGATVNLASRLESNAHPNSICITPDNIEFFQKDKYSFAESSLKCER